MQEEDRRASTSSGDPNDDAIRDLDVIERDPGISGASPISRTILIMAFHPIGFFDGHPCDRVRAGLAASRGLFNSRPIGLLR